MLLIPDTLRIFTHSLVESCRFYEEKLGWSVVGGSMSEGFVIFRPGGVQIILEEVDKRIACAEQLCPRFTGLSLRCRSIDAVYSSLVACGVEFVEQPTEMPWGGWLAHFKDEEGNVISLVEYEGEMA